jgi:hypothetical protein
MPNTPQDHIFYMGQWYTREEIENLDKNNL